MHCKILESEKLKDVKCEHLNQVTNISPFLVNQSCASMGITIVSALLPRILCSSSVGWKRSHIVAQPDLRPNSIDH
jgi:hypothetical protein